MASKTRMGEKPHKSGQAEYKSKVPREPVSEERSAQTWTPVHRVGFGLLPEQRAGSGRLDGRSILLPTQLEHRSGHPVSAALRGSTPRPSRALLLCAVGAEKKRPEQEVWAGIPTETGIQSRRPCWKEGGTRYNSVCSWRADTALLTC